MNNTFKIIKSIFAINPTAQFTFEEEDIDNIQWLNGTTPISKSGASKIVVISGQSSSIMHFKRRLALFSSSIISAFMYL